MTAAILHPGVESILTIPPSDQVQDVMNDVWHRARYQTTSEPVNHYWMHGHGPIVGAGHDADLRIFHGDLDYGSPFQDGASMISPSLRFLPDANFGSDIDVATPSTTAGFPEVGDGYLNLRHTSNHEVHLHPFIKHERAHSTNSPGSSPGGISPLESFVELSNVISKRERPTFTRSVTAPGATETRTRKAVSSVSSVTASAKRSGSEDEDDEYMPVEESKPRGRKRQRIPHTAVERRYRENLNAHLDKLRQAVPSLASKRTAGGSKPGDGMGDSVKPSKCEVLSGAIEHINALGKDNASLRMEVKTLRSRLDELERWCSSVQNAELGR